MVFTIIWLLYILVVFYNVTDATQTIILMELGVGEANFIMNYAIEMSGNNLIIFFVKAVPISILGVLLYFYQKILKREDRKK